MQTLKLTAPEIDQLVIAGRQALEGMSPNRKVEVITFFGKRYRVVRANFRGGFQIQSANGRTLVTEGML